MKSDIYSIEGDGDAEQVTSLYAYTYLKFSSKKLLNYRSNIRIYELLQRTRRNETKRRNAKKY